MDYEILFISIAILFCFSGPLFLVFVYPRYYILDGTRSGVDIAAEIVEKKRNPKECNNILDFDPFPSPSAQEQSNLCVYMYAELTKDPFACELLLPSIYAMDCIGAASIPEPCTFMSDRSVRWMEGEATLKQCMESQITAREGQQCCTIAKVTFLNGYDDCVSLENSPEMIDQCFGELAYKKKDSSICEKIDSDNLRSACTVRVTALATYSELPYFAPIDYK